MHIITVVNAKGGCGKSTIAMNLAACLAGSGRRTLLLDLDPQAQLTAWLGLGDGLTSAGTMTAVLAGRESLPEVIQATRIPGLHFVAASDELESIGRSLAECEGYHDILATALTPLLGQMDFTVIDSPNQVSPVMEMAVVAGRLFIIPFESTKAVKSVANLYKLILHRRPLLDYQPLHVSCNLTRQPGLRRRVMLSLEREGLQPAPVEISSCGWLARADDYGGSIFHYRPTAKGARDMRQLTDLVIQLTSVQGRVAA